MLDEETDWLAVDPEKHVRLLALSWRLRHIVSETFFSRVRQTARVNLPLGGSQRCVSVRI